MLPTLQLNIIFHDLCFQTPMLRIQKLFSIKPLQQRHLQAMEFQKTAAETYLMQTSLPSAPFDWQTFAPLDYQLGQYQHSTKD